MAGFRWTIKRKLLALGLGTLLPVLFLIAYWGWWEIREYTERAEAELTLASRQAADRVEDVLGQIVTHLGSLARSPAIQRRQVREMETRFRDLIAEHGELENVFALAVDGRTFASAVPVPAGTAITVADRPWFRQVMSTGRPAVSGFLTGRLTGRPVAVVAVPIRIGNDFPTGALAVSLSLRRLHLLFHALPLAGGMAVTVIDGEGQVLSHSPEGEGWIGKRFPSLPSLAPGPAVVKRLAWSEGGKRIAGVAPVGDTGWRVLVAIPGSALEGRIWREIGTIGLPLLALLAVSSLIGLLIARRVWQPLQALAVAARQFPQGEEVSVEVPSTDEAGELTRAFQEMAAQINDARSKLERRVSELEALSEAGRLLTGTLELPEVLQRLAELTLRRLEADVVRIWLREPSSEGLRLHADAGTTRRGEQHRVRLGPGEGLVGRIIGGRETLVLTDMQGDPRLENRRWVKDEGLHAFLGVPIVLEDVPVGVLAVMRRSTRAFSPDDVAWAAVIALPAAAAVQNARLYEEVLTRARELAESNRRLQLLHEAARTIAAEHDLDRLLQHLVETALDSLKAGYGALVLFGADARVGQLFTAGIADEERERIKVLPEGRGLLGHVFRQGETLRLDDLTAHPAAVGFPPGHPPMRNLLAAPIRFREKIQGALYLTEKPGGFTVEDEALLTTLCADAAVAMENAHLVAHLRRALDDLKAAEERLVRGEVLRAVGQLASGTAHHLNNLLAVILGRVQLLLDKARDPDLRRPLEIIDRVSREAASVVRRLLESSRVERVSAPAQVDMNQLAQDVVELTQPLWKDEAQSRGIPIEVSLEAGHVPPVAGEPHALREVLMNIVLNAIDALPEGGNIAIKTWASAASVCFPVADTGIGMSEEVRRRALEPFFTAKGPKRTGLGLSVSDSVVQRHGGTLSMESTPGRGTTVTISLPAAPAKPAVTPAPSAAPMPVSARRILVIDDEAEVREVLADILTHQGHLVSQAASGADGIAMFQAVRHDLVFTDFGMPGMTGLQVAKAIKALRATTPVVLITGWRDEPGTDPDGTAVDQIISKPFDLNALTAALRRAQAGGQHERSNA